MRYALQLQTLLCLGLLRLCVAVGKFNQRQFVSAKAINFADPMKNGFRVILHDEFLKQHLSPTLLPTLYVTAIPLRAGENEKPTVRIVYPDAVYEDKQIQIVNLRERSWYFVCVEFESFNRHNETTGADCRLFRTLDRFGKASDTTIADVEITDIAASVLGFRLRALVDFPIRISARLNGANTPVVSAQQFLLSDSSDLDAFFPNLRPGTNYGQLCITEEPLVTGYSGMGRLVSGLFIEKCYFGSLQTKDYDIATDVKAYRTSSAAKASLLFSLPIVSSLVPALFYKILRI